MGSRFIEKTTSSTGNSGPFKDPEKPILTWFQFVPALVVDVIVNAFNPYYESDRDLNAVIVKVHYKDAFGANIDSNALSTEKYYPLFSRITDPPIIGEQVLVCTFGGINYYMGPINTVNLVNFNPDTLRKKGINFSDSKSSINLTTKNFRILNNKRLQKLSNPFLDDVDESELGDIHGDMIIQGRHNNSVRIGGRSDKPYIMISNSKNSSNPIESLFDGSIISMTSFGAIESHYPKTINEDTAEEENYILPSDRGDGSRIIGEELYNYNYMNNQLIQASGKITIGSNSDSIFLSSFNDVVIGANNNLQIITNKATIIESSNIYLGKQAQEQKEPLVLGTQITDILKEIVSILETMKVTGCIAGLSGPPAPDVIAKITNLKTTLDAVPHLSEYHFIEDNGQKAE
tara:strand:+ start:1241 stop:2449 length:1209 start_codon:yes stop_codon:yes gene_type:complete